MRRPPTASSALVRLFTGLITVWCLGCSGFDPLLDSLVGSSSDMICGSAMTMSQSADGRQRELFGGDREPSLVHARL